LRASYDFLAGGLLRQAGLRCSNGSAVFGKASAARPRGGPAMFASDVDSGTNRPLCRGRFVRSKGGRRSTRSRVRRAAAFLVFASSKLVPPSQGPGENLGALGTPSRRGCADRSGCAAGGSSRSFR
jgi:hypothetical protein